MSSVEALVTALSMVNRPQLTSRAREGPLPKGVTFVLRIAAGEPDAVNEACLLTGQTERHLRKAAGFFVEQVLLTQPVDHYRVLGCNRSSSNGDLRRHMALMMKWLHPDVVGDGSLGFDKSLYASRVTKAWEALKTDERRATYDNTLVTKTTEQRTANLLQSHRTAPPLKQTVASEKRLRIAPYPPPIKSAGFWTRIFSLFAGRP